MVFSFRMSLVFSSSSRDGSNVAGVAAGDASGCGTKARRDDDDCKSREAFASVPAKLGAAAGSTGVVSPSAPVGALLLVVVGLTRRGVRGT